MSDNVNVLHIMSGFGGGISSFILNKAEAMSSYPVVFDVVTYDDVSERFANAIKATGGDIYKLANPKEEGWKAFYQSFSTPLKAKKYDVVHCHINGYRVLPYYIIAKLNGVKRFYVHSHLTPVLEDNFKNRLKSRLDIFCNKLTTTAYVGCAKDAIKAAFGDDIPTSKMVELPNSIDADFFILPASKRHELRRNGRNKLNIKDDQVVLGHIARLMPIKNHNFTLKLAKIIKESKLPYVILLAGSGELEDSIKSKIKEEKLEDVIKVLGRVEPIEEFYPVLDVLLLPSFAEGFPTVVVEAQASGLPVIMSDRITDEVDIGLGLVERLPLDKPNMWLKQVEKSLAYATPSNNIRQEALEKRALTNETGASVYNAFLTNKITSFLMEEGRGAS